MGLEINIPGNYYNFKAFQLNLYTIGYCDNDMHNCVV